MIGASYSLFLWNFKKKASTVSYDTALFFYGFQPKDEPRMKGIKM